MRSRPAYTPCKLRYDPAGLALDVGQYLQSPAGSAYLVQGISPARNGVHLNLQCLRWPSNEIPAGATVHPIYWYRRKRRARRLSELGQPPMKGESS